jgi:hypothetical protein
MNPEIIKAKSDKLIDSLVNEKLLDDTFGGLPELNRRHILLFCKLKCAEMFVEAYAMALDDVGALDTNAMDVTLRMIEIMGVRDFMIFYRENKKRFDLIVSCQQHGGLWELRRENNGSWDFGLSEIK